MFQETGCIPRTIISLDWLQKAYEERNGWMAYLQVVPRLDTLRDEPRFQNLLARMNFPEG